MPVYTEDGNPRGVWYSKQLVEVVEPPGWRQAERKDGDFTLGADGEINVIWLNGQWWPLQLGMT